MIKIATRLFYIIGFFYGSIIPAYSQELENDIFQISILSIDAPYATINAELVVSDGRLITGVGGSYDWQRGWADYVSDMSAETTGGETLTVSEQGESFDSYWLLALDGKAFNGTAEVSYKVDLIYARTEWDFGNEQAGRIYQGGLYTVTKPFFLSSGSDRNTEIHFDLPVGWDIASPWQELPGEEDVFLADNWDALHNNSITIGEFDRAKKEINGFELEIILLGDFKSAPPLVSETIEKVLPVYLELFPDTPKAKYMMTYLNGPSEDAEAFHNGAAFTTSLSLSPDNRIFWADFLAHELFHFWNGVRIRAKERSEGNWFSEGFTDYYANLVLVNRGVLSENWFMRRMENIFGNYLYFQFSGLFEGLSVLDAGKEKGRNRFGIYDAGWVLAFALDNEINTRTGGDKSLDDVMTSLYDRYGKTEERYELDDMLAIISSSTGLDLDPFFDTYLKSRTALPLVKIMDTFGMDVYSNNYANEFYLTKDNEASAEEIARWQSLTQARFPEKIEQSTLDVKSFKKNIETAIIDTDFSGTIAVMDGEEIIFQRAYGNRDENNKLPNLIDTGFITASITKMVTSTMIAILWDRGDIDFDATIGTYLTDLKQSRPDIANSVTVRQLLSHSSGLGNYKSGNFWQAANHIYTLEDIVPFTSGEELAFESGTSYQYSNTGYLYLGLIIEAILKTDYYSAVAEHILKPLDMTDSGFWTRETLSANRAILYTKLSAETQGFQDKLIEAGPWLEGRGGPGGGLTSTALDLMKFSKVYSGDALISKKARALFHSPQIQRRAFDKSLLDNDYYGFGVGILNPGAQGERLGHAGGDPGTSSLLYYYPKLGLTIAVLSNRDTFSGASQPIDFDDILMNYIKKSP
jgi:CubicO group peptidase (beta-lactamase class C family)